MNKYLKTENASITIEYSSNLKNFLNDNILYIDSICVHRLYIECKAKDLEKLSNDLKGINVDNVVIFILINDYSNKYYDILNSINNNFYTIISCNIKEYLSFKKSSDIFYQINFNYTEKEKIVDLINSYDNLIFNIEYALDNIKSTNESLKYIINNISKENISFSNLFISKDLIYNCPYNIYLNNKNSRAKYGNNIPRNIYIDKDGFVYCLKIKNPNIIIGNILNNNLKDIFKECKKTVGYKKFINYNELLFIELLDQCPYKMIDYIAFLNEVMCNYE